MELSPLVENPSEPQCGVGPAGIKLERLTQGSLITLLGQEIGRRWD
jgi:hypothetical protein